MAAVRAVLLFVKSDLVLEDCYRNSHCTGKSITLVFMSSSRDKSTLRSKPQSADVSVVRPP